MPEVVYLLPGGERKVIDVPEGESVMGAAIRHGIPGIVATCGGACMCATCHVYVQERNGARIPTMGDEEDGMLDFAAAPRRATSRLSCQLTVDEGTVGLVVEVPDVQV